MLEYLALGYLLFSFAVGCLISFIRARTWWRYKKLVESLDSLDPILADTMKASVKQWVGTVPAGSSVVTSVISLILFIASVAVIWAS